LLLARGEERERKEERERREEGERREENYSQNARSFRWAAKV
jgi:hypothetical protein